MNHNSLLPPNEESAGQHEVGSEVANLIRPNPYSCITLLSPLTATTPNIVASKAMESEPDPEIPQVSSHAKLVQWATETQNITLSGVYPTAIPNKGLGMAATRDIKVRHDLLLSSLLPMKVPRQH